MSQTDQQAAAACASCNKPLSGRYCSHCGERALDPHSLTVRHFIAHTLAHEVLHLDGKIWRTLRNLVFRPGFLTSEYFAGRRRIYVNPLRMLVTAIIAYVLLTQGGLVFSLQIGTLTLSVAPTRTPDDASVADTVVRIDRFGILANLLAEKVKSLDTTADAVR